MNIILNINEKFNNGKEQDSELYYEVLHSSLMELLRNLTKEQYDKIALPTRSTVEKLEKCLIEKTSKTYQQQIFEYEQENGKFKKVVKTEKEKNRIDFVFDEEGTTI